MNRLQGVVTAVQSAGQVALADVEVAGDTLSALVVESDAQAEYLRPGTAVLVLFQETEVSLAKNLSGLISLRNRLRARIKSMDKGGVLTRVVLDYRGQDIVAIITTRSAKRLALAPGDEVEGLVKANEVTLVPREER
mgnify:CR=1 FL=1